MKYLKRLEFTTEVSRYMHIDLNSCFATIEQQANHFLRGKPIAVAAYVTPNGCILASSIEAKKFGIKTGMRVKDAKKLYKKLIVREPDSHKYRYVHLKLRHLLLEYTNELYPKSIDEFVLDMYNTPSYKKGMFEVGQEIKQRIKVEVGDYITVSIGIAPNKFLAKTASGLQKPDGLCELNKLNFQSVFSKLELMDLCGVAIHNLARLNSVGIYTVTDFYNAAPQTLKSAFGSINGYYWYLNLRGFELGDYDTLRKSFSNSYALPKVAKNLNELAPILTKLVEKMSSRLRTSGYKTLGVFLALNFDDRTYWHMSSKTREVLFDSRDIYREILRLFLKAPKKGVKLLAVGCFNLIVSDVTQLYLFADAQKKERLVEALDDINTKWGNFTLFPATMLTGNKKYVRDRIGFGRVRELEDGFDSIQSW